MNNYLNDIVDEGEVKLINGIVEHMGDTLNPVFALYKPLDAFYALQGLYGIIAIQMYEFTKKEKLPKEMFAKACALAIELQILEAFRLEEGEE